MLDWVITFLILAFISGVLGFSGVAIVSAQIAQAIFGIFIFFIVISILLGLASRHDL
jgi:uncharacterized membrane protein YtjA (UPF0391 family)